MESQENAARCFAPPPTTSKAAPKRYKVLLGVTASVAAIKIPEIVQRLVETGHVEEIRIIPTETSLKFFNPSTLITPAAATTDAACSTRVGNVSVKLFRDSDEWSMWNGRGDPVLHIELVKWADIIILAPLDANTLGKVSNGICDNLLTCVIRAWDLKSKKPVVFCPAMNTKMWEHPLTSEQVQRLVSFGYHYVPPVEKTLMCGDTGIGAMALVDTIIQTFLSQSQ